MKKLLLILSFFTVIHFSSYAQDNDGGRLQDKMTEYIQQKLGLSKTEADKFSPVFLDYFRDLRKTNQDYKGDRLVLQQKIVELRLRYRDQFKPIIGDKRSNDVFTYERDFIKGVKELQQDRLQNRLEGRANKRNNPGL
jgi:hypothetical protein